MALHHAALFFTLIFFICLASANALGRRETQFQGRSPQQRLTRGTEFLKYQNMELGTARGYGKRAVDMHNVNNLLDWIALESRMRDMGIGKNFRSARRATIPE